MADVSPEQLAAWHTTVVLADGSTADVRPIVPEDGERLAAFHSRQSAESIYFRYFRFRPELSAAEIEHFTNVDYLWRMAFIATIGDEMVAVARYEGKAGEPTAEVAFFVDDGHQRKGLGTLLLEFLAAAARQSALEGLTATVLAENYRMLRVFRNAGFEVSSSFVDGVIEVDLGIELTEEAAAAIDDRARSSTVRSVARLLEPTSIAVVGASRRPDAVGRALFDRLRGHGFAGPVIPVNRKATEIDGVPAVASLGDLTEPVDLAVVAVPAAEVAGVINDGVAAGIGGFLLISSGPTGADDELDAEAIIRAARAAGVRLIGPNSFGIVNTDPDHRVHALFVPVEVTPGRVAVLSQSGPLGAALLDRLRAAGVGVSSFVAMGDRSDVSVNDVLSYWAVDDRTDAVVLYLDDFGNLRNFTRVARHLAASTPVFALGPRTGDLAELLERSGVVVVERAAELVTGAAVAASQPPAAGPRAVVLSNSASIGRLCATAADRHGLQLTTPAVVAELEGVRSHGDGVVLVPVDRSLDELETVVASLALAAEVDAVVLAVTPSLQNAPGDIAAALDRIDGAVDKPMVATALTDDDHLSNGGLPIFRFPEDAVAALARHVADGVRRSASDVAALASIESDPALGAALEEALASSASMTLRLGDPSLGPVLEAIGVPVPATKLVASASDTTELLAARRSIEGSVVVKAGGLGRRHPGAAGGTVLDLEDDDDLVAAAAALVAHHGDAADPLIVQAMTSPGPRATLEVEVDRATGAWLSVAREGGSVTRAPLPATAEELSVLVAALEVDPEQREAAEILVRGVARLGADVRLRSLRAAPVLLGPDGPGIIEIDVELVAPAVSVLAEVRHLAD